jgi:signal transduction histidine kinase
VSEISLLAESREPGFVIRDPVELADLTESVLTKASALAPDRTWVLDETASGLADFDSRRITQAWLQLADNAVKYSTAGGEIRLGSSVSRGRTKDEVQLWVRDSGPGISDEDRERVFDRFVRLDATRDSDGSGLGLAIVAAIAEAHGGDVRLSSSADGSVFTIALPISAEARADRRDDSAQEDTDESEDSGT